MISGPSLPDLGERYQYLLRVISDPAFLEMKGLGNELPFFICPYPPQETLEMARIVKQLIRALGKKGIPVLDINLYDLALEILAKRNLLERMIASESNYAKDQFLELLQSVLDVETRLIPALAEKMGTAKYAVLFITGVGEVFPYIRSHNVLNNLQIQARNKPTLLFFPGAYTYSPGAGSSLNLFGRLQDDKYYRAFDIFEFGGWQAGPPAGGSQ